MDKLNKAILDSKIVSRKVAEEIAKHILYVINLNHTNLKGDILISTANYLKDHELEVERSDDLYSLNNLSLMNESINQFYREIDVYNPLFID